MAFFEVWMASISVLNTRDPHFGESEAQQFATLGVAREHKKQHLQNPLMTVLGLSSVV